MTNEQDEFEFYAADEDYPLIPDDEYWAECTEYKKQDYFIKGQIKKKKLYLCFHVYANENSLDNMSEKIWMAFNMPLNGRVGKRSKYWMAWKKVWGSPPSRKALMSPKIFLNRHYKIKTRTVKRYHGGEVRPEDEWYSVVDEILMALPKTYPNN